VENCNGEIDAVDIFEGETVSGDCDGNNVISYNIGNSYYELLEKYKNNSKVKLHKSYSTQFFENTENNKYDIIYIDGDHSYNGVKNDLKNAFKKIKHNGYIMGHDYEMNMIKAKTSYNFGVKDAVDEFCLSHNQTILSKAMDGCVSFCIKVNKEPTISKKNLVYTTIGYNEKWFDIILLLLFSIEKYTTIKDFDFLLICDDNMYDSINNIIKTELETELSFKVKLHNIKRNSSAPDKASINKLYVFDFEEIDNYQKILFIDGDIISLYDLKNVFNNILCDDILYVYKEIDDINCHNHIFWGLENYTPLELERFEEKNIYPFNCGLFLFNNTIGMKEDFKNIILFISTYNGKSFYEQSFMNYYFNKKESVNYEIFNNNNYKLGVDCDIKYPNKIVHFSGANNSGYTKFEMMKYYITIHNL
jgi:hypothetical protein